MKGYEERDECIVNLRIKEHKTYREIADIVGVTRSQVTHILNRESKAAGKRLESMAKHIDVVFGLRQFDDAHDIEPTNFAPLPSRPATETERGESSVMTWLEGEKSWE